MTLIEFTQVLLESNIQSKNQVLKIAKQIRDKYIKLRNGEGINLYGTCLDACDDLFNILSNLGYTVNILDGYAIFDILDNTEITYDYHTICEIIIDNRKYYIDTVADQFEDYITDIENDVIFTNNIPDWFSLTKPDFSQQNY